MKARWTIWNCCIAVILVAPLMIGCGGDAPTASIPAESTEEGDAEVTLPETDTSVATSSQIADTAPVVPIQNLYPEVLIQTSMGNIKIKLDAKLSPATVDNFLENYVDRDFYDDTIFHHVDTGYVMAGGYSKDLQPKDARAPIRNESMNGLKNVRGTVTMSRSPEYADSATSEFFINVSAAPTLDYDEENDKAGYCVFGTVTEGMDVVDAISKVKHEASEDLPQVPVEPVVIQSIERI